MRSATMAALLGGLVCPLSPRQAAGQRPGPRQERLVRQQKGKREISPEFRRLEFLVGRWEEDITYAGATNSTTKGRGRWVARPALGSYLFINYASARPEGQYRAHGVLTYDPDAQVYRMFWFDNAGGIAEYRGNWAGENSLVLEYRGKVNGRNYRERIRYTRAAPGEVDTKIEQAWDSGDYQPYLDAVAHRVGEVGRGGTDGSPNPRGARHSRSNEFVRKIAKGI